MQSRSNLHHTCAFALACSACFRLCLCSGVSVVLQQHHLVTSRADKATKAGYCDRLSFVDLLAGGFCVRRLLEGFTVSAAINMDNTRRYLQG